MNVGDIIYDGDYYGTVITSNDTGYGVRWQNDYNGKRYFDYRDYTHDVTWDIVAHAPEGTSSW